MRIAVTGAAGFLGRYVLSELAKHSVDVVAVHRDTGTVPCSEREPERIHLDVAGSPDNAFELLGRPDVLIHLAWGGLPNYRSVHHFEVELPMHYRFLSALVRQGLSAVVVSGTCFEYGLQSGQLSEEIETHPSNPYGYAKDALRRQLEFLRATRPFALTWARLFYLYGDGQSATSLWPQFQQSIERGDTVFPMSGGEQLRDYLHVAVAAKHLVLLALHKAELGVVNICSGSPTSIRRLVEGWIAARESSLKLHLGYYDYSDYESLAFWGDRRRLDQFLESIEDVG